MKGSIGVLLLAGVAVLGCRRKEEKPPMPGTPPGHGAMASRKPSVVQVPEAIQAKWKAARFRVSEKGGGNPKDFVAQVGRDTPIPGTPLTLKVEALLPHFSMGDGVITSRSEQLANPAAKVGISQGGQPVFNGWFFSMFPEAHPFEHPTLQIRLVEFVPAEGAR